MATRAKKQPEQKVQPAFVGACKHCGEGNVCPHCGTCDNCDQHNDDSEDDREDDDG